jgi:hypothetical protein
LRDDQLDCLDDAGAFFGDYVIAHCPDCQTAVKTLKDRRPSRRLK